MKKNMMVEVMKETLRTGTEEDKRRVVNYLMFERCKHAAFLFINTVVTGLYEGKEEEGEAAYNDFLRERNCEYLYLPFPVPEGTWEKFEKELQKVCVSCPMDSICLTGEKTIQTSVSKGMIFELVQSIHNFIKKDKLSGVFNEFLEKLFK